LVGDKASLLIIAGREPTCRLSNCASSVAYPVFNRRRHDDFVASNIEGVVEEQVHVLGDHEGAQTVVADGVRFGHGRLLLVGRARRRDPPRIGVPIARSTALQVKMSEPIGTINRRQFAVRKPGSSQIQDLFQQVLKK